MKTIWAPWRMAYIKSTKTAKEGDCFLCDIFRSSRDRANLVLKRGKKCVIVFNRYPYSSGHLMVAPIRHVASLAAMTRPEVLEMMQLVNECVGVLTKCLQPHGFNIGINLGEVAGAGLKDHLHMHVVPRWRGDTNFMPVLADVKVMPESLETLWKQLRSALAKKAKRRK